MIKFILSSSFENFSNNQELIEQNNYNNLFWGIENNLPFSIFNGKINNNFYNFFADYDIIKNTINSYNEISNNLILFDFGNTLIEKKDFENCYATVIFEEYAKSKNAFFEIADVDFIDFLVNEYPNIQIILHENYTIFHNEDEIINLINLYPNNIKAINITILNLCQNISIQKIGIINLDSCFYCPQFPLCLQNEHQNILRYKKASIFNECTKKKLITIDNIVKSINNMLEYTDTFLFQTIACEQTKDYMNCINKILEKESEGVFNEKL